MGDQTNIKTFKEQFDEFMKWSGWDMKENSYKKNVQQPGQKISINGQTREIPGKTMAISIEYFGEGDINGVPFYEVSMLSTVFCCYDIDEFKIYYNEIFS